jgi:hypothetical protein
MHRETENRAAGALAALVPGTIVSGQHRKRLSLEELPTQEAVDDRIRIDRIKSAIEKTDPASRTR